MFAVGGINAPTDGSPVLSRAVRVTAGRSSLFLKALVAKHGITMHGNGVMTDSFDSTDPAHSDNGMYPSGNLSKLLDNGDIASNDSAIGIVDAGNANVYGHVAVGPKGTISLGPNGGVGTHAWQSFNGGIEPGYFTDDMNFTFPSVTLPFKVGLTPTSGTISTTNYTYVSGTTNITSSTYPNPVPASGVQTNATYATVSYIPNPVPYGLTTNVLTTTTTTTTMPAAGTYLGTYTVTTITSGPKSGRGTYYTYNLITGTNYTYPTLSYTYSYATYTTNFTVTTASYDNIIQGGAPNLPPVDYYVGSLSGSVYVRGNARLVVNGNCSVGDLTIDSDGVLQMYVNGSSLSLAGNNTMNRNGYAQRLIIWCTDNVTSLSMSGNAGFTGCIVAPNANMSLNGGGNDNYDFVGSLLINSITMNGHFSFHYDEALKSYGGGSRYIITKWDEIPLAQAGR
jgi:hypothetical protein